MNNKPWQVAFIVLQVVFTLVLGAFIVELRGFGDKIELISQRVYEVEKQVALNQVKVKNVEDDVTDMRIKYGMIIPSTKD